MVPPVVYLSRPTDTDTDQPASFQALVYSIDSTYGFRYFRPATTAGLLATEQLKEWDAAGAFAHRRVIQGTATTTRASAAGVTVAALPASDWGWLGCYGWFPVDGTYTIGTDVVPTAAGALADAVSAADVGRFVVGMCVVANTDALISVI